ncbi:type II toxin-antitoxin system RelB/DinJ family antitoxin [uncultured Brachyspira sp.]|uniref:type II toxin-antitoxin system RelB/DinJ family antitoxin n=1 Tax=uncultured Brachyspira sp. TaxID=221953 RepID=UPI0025EECF47|nr:type II toxin-antitoxin system RelB/DinJ family antitoxin [uncultured Brachyspira sp.]
MPKIIMQIEIDDELKKNADELFNELGLDTNTAINIFLKKSISNQSIPFRIKRNKKYNFYNKKNIDLLKSRYNNLKKGDGIEVKELIDE